VRRETRGSSRGEDGQLTDPRGFLCCSWNNNDLAHEINVLYDTLLKRKVTLDS
jgi:hypothetical protein